MRRKEELERKGCGRPAERGAALVSVLLLSTLLLSAGGVLLLTTSMSATNPADSAAEMHAYYAAEAGLQRTLNVMRSNDLPAGSKPKLSFRDVALNPTLAGWLPLDGPTINGAKTTLVGTDAFSVSISDPDDPGPVKKITLDPNYNPTRLNIIVTAYGPKRSRKVLNMLVLRGGLAGFKAPATITLRGADDPLSPLTFDTGDSNAARYSGKDSAGGSGISAFAVTIPDVPPTILGIQKPLAQVEGTPLSVLSSTSPYADIPPTPPPDWLETADAARQFLSDMRESASLQNRLFTTKPDETDMGTVTVPKMTFVDGDVTLGSGDQGAGLLIVTGKLTTRGDTNFRGVIMVLGEGSVERNGAGDGLISGGIVIAKFGSTGGFLSPSFITKGGGNSRVQYNSNDFDLGPQTVPGFQVLGVVEK